MSSKIERDTIDIESFYLYFKTNRTAVRSHLIKNISNDIKSIAEYTLSKFVETGNDDLLREQAFLIQSLSIDGQYGNPQYAMVTFKSDSINATEIMIVTHRDRRYEFLMDEEGEYHRVQ